mgnify:CR=1 FL=1
MGLLNMDEFDKYGTQQMPLLKNLMQMANLNICKAYQKNFRNLPRIASFIGTSMTAIVASALLSLWNASILA